LMALLTFLSLCLAGYAISGWAGGREEVEQARLRRVAAMTGGAPLRESPLLKDQRLSGIVVFNALLARISLVEPVVRMIRQAGLKRRAGEVLLYIPLLACSAFLLAALIGASPPIGVVAGAIAGSVPLLVVQRMRVKRAERFGAQLPDALDLIRAALQAGHGFLSTLGVVADEFPDPIAQELREVAEEMRLGLPMRDALYNLIDRVDDPNLPILVVGILVAHEVGGNLAEVLDNVSHTIRERFKILRDTQVLTAAGRLSGGVLTALPFIVALIMFLLNPTYFTPLVSDPVGRYMIAYGLLSLLAGHLVIRRLVKIKV